MMKIIKFWDAEPAFVVEGEVLKKMQEDSIVMCENFGTKDIGAIKTELDGFFNSYLNCAVTNVKKLSNCVYLVETNKMPNPLARVKMRMSGINIYWGNDFLDDYELKQILPECNNSEEECYEEYAL